MKYEWRRQEKQLYGAKTTPVLVTVPTQSCIMINEHLQMDLGMGNEIRAHGFFKARIGIVFRGLCGQNGLQKDCKGRV